MSVAAAVIVILGALVATVVATMLLEHRGVVSQEIVLGGPRSHGGPGRIVSAEGTPVVEPITVPLAVAAPDPAREPRVVVHASPLPIEPNPVVTPVHPAPVELEPLAPAAGLGWGVLTTGPSSISLRDADVVDTMSGVLFAAYVASGGTAAKRVSGWVSVRVTPPSLDAEAFPPGADLRGKVGRVETLLDCDDLDATWVVLQRRVDIARGLVRSPVTDPVLAGLLVWWRASQTLPTVLSTDESADLASAIAAIEDRLSSHPWRTAVSQLRSALLDGVVHGREVLLGVAGPEGPDDSTGTEPTGPEAAGQVGSASSSSSTTAPLVPHQ